MAINRFSFTADLEYGADSIESFIQMIEKKLDRLVRNKSIRFFMKVAVNELVVNAVEHGYNKNGGKVSVHVWIENNSVCLEVSDFGKGVRKELLNLDRVVESYDDLTERGWGLPIINKVSSTFRITTNKPTGTIISLTMLI
jgi:stage II sporulation protein AB (anti-sigma F factor)